MNRLSVVKHGGGSIKLQTTLILLLLEALNVFNEWWNLRQFRITCVTQCQKTRFEIKVFSVLTGLWTKAHIKQHRRMVKKEKMDCFKLVSNRSSPRFLEKLWRELKSAIAKRTFVNLKELECIAMSETSNRWLQGNYRNVLRLFWVIVVPLIVSRVNAVFELLCEGFFVRGNFQINSKFCTYSSWAPGLYIYIQTFFIFFYIF